MAARYEPGEVEKRLMKRWLESGSFNAPVDDDSRPTYTVSIPPPNVTGSLHMGHALNDTIQDILIRYHHLKGFNTLWVLGTDHAGIATQNKVEARLAGEGLKKEDLGREGFHREGVGVEAGVRQHHHPPDEEPGLRRRLRERALHHGRGLPEGGGEGLRLSL